MEQEEAFGSDARFLQIRQNDAAGVLEKCSILLNHKLVLISFLFWEQDRRWVSIETGQFRFYLLYSWRQVTLFDPKRAVLSGTRLICYLRLSVKLFLAKLICVIVISE